MNITEEQVEKICDYYCRFPKDKDFSAEQRAALCDNCPMSEIINSELKGENS